MLILRIIKILVAHSCVNGSGHSVPAHQMERGAKLSHVSKSLTQNGKVCQLYLKKLLIVTQCSGSDPHSVVKDGSYCRAHS